MSTSTKSTKRKRSAIEIAAELRTQIKGLVGARVRCWTTCQRRVKPVQIRFYGTDSRKLMEITNEFMAKLRQVPAPWTWACQDSLPRTG